MMSRHKRVFLALCLGAWVAHAAAEDRVVIDAARLPGRKATLAGAPGSLVDAAGITTRADMKPGRVRVQAFLRFNGKGKAYGPTPFVLTVGDASATVTVDALADGVPLELSVEHRKAALPIAIREGTLPPEAKAERLRLEAAAGAGKGPALDLESDAADTDAAADLLEELDVLDASAAPLPLVLVDRIEVTRLSGPLLITAVTTDKITYRPGETATVTVTMNNIGAGQTRGRLAVDCLEGLDARTRVIEEEVTLAAGGTLVRSGTVPVGTGLWGRGIEATIDTPEGADRGTHAFSVVTDVWMAAFPGTGLPQFGSERWTPEQAEQEAEAIARANMANYANMYEAFAWAPCDYSRMTVNDDEPFYSGQTQYAKRRSSLLALHRVFHKYGIGCVTYGKSCGSGIPGVEYALRHPERMNVFAPAGFAHETISVDILDRMLENRYRQHGRDEDFWQSWISSWTMIGNLDAANFGCDEIVRSAREFGWDGVRYDGHFAAWDNPAMSARVVRHCVDRIQDQIPGFGIGYNHCGPKHGTAEGAFSDAELAACARAGGLIMSEYYRNILGPVKDNIEHLRWAGDATRLHGGYFLAISDDGSPWAKALMLAGGARPMGGGSHFGKFATRFSGFMLDPAMRRLEDPARLIKPGKNADFRWDAFVYEKPLSPTGSLLVMQLVNVTDRFHLGGVAGPPSGVSGPRRQIEFDLALPEGYRATGVHAWDDEGGFASMPATLDGGRLVIPTLRQWTLAVVSLARDEKAADLASRCEIPLTFKDAPKNDSAARAELKLAAAVGPQTVQAINAARTKITPALLDAILADGELKDSNPGAAASVAADFSKHTAGTDAAARPATSAPLQLRRDGRPDLLVVRGVFSHLDRLDEAVAGVPGSIVHDAFLSNGSGACAAKLEANKAGCLEGWPNREALARMDVVVLDEIPAPALALDQRRDLLDFVRGGGGLLVLGGWYSLSRGSWEGSFLEEALPVEVVQTTFLRRLAPKEQLLAATPAYAEALGKPPVFEKAGGVAWLNHVRPRSGAEILVTAGDLPVLVSGTCGVGQAIVWAGSHSGEAVAPYWTTAAWPAVLRDCLRRLAKGAERVDPPDAAVAAQLAAARSLLDDRDLDALAEDDAPASGRKADDGVPKAMQLLLDDGGEADALAVANYLLDHPDALDPAAFGGFSDAIAGKIGKEPGWAKLAERYRREPPHGLGNLVAEIAASALPTIRFAEIRGWKIDDPVTRLRCIAAAADPAAVPDLEADLGRLVAQEARATENLYETRLVRPFVAYALIRCGKRDEATLHEFCKGVLELPYYAWRQRWVREGAVAFLADATQMKSPAMVATAKTRIRLVDSSIRRLDRAVACVAPLFDAESITADEAGRRAVARALREADCRKALPLALGFLESVPPERRRELQGLDEALLPSIRFVSQALTAGEEKTR